MDNYTRARHTGFVTKPSDEEIEQDNMNFLEDKNFWKDLLIGFIYGLVTCFAIGFWGLLLACTSAILWALGGQGYLRTKAWRRLGCPVVVCIAFWNAPLVLVSLVLQILVQSVGYGEPDLTDEGSWLGRKFGRWTRLVWYGLIIVSMVPLLY